MAWIEGTEQQTFVLDAHIDEVFAFFSDPGTFQDCLIEVEVADQIEPTVWRWVLEEKAAKGISYQPDYTVEYEQTGPSRVGWTTVEGNMRSEGYTQCTELDAGRTEVEYHETIAADLPIPGLMAKLFSPIVSREIRKGVGSFLDCARQRFGG